MNRRSFLKSAAAALPLRALAAHAETVSRASGMSALRSTGYGPLINALDEATGLQLLKLPDGFRYVSVSWAGDMMADAQRAPGKHDGIGAFAAGPSRVRLVRNHETDRGGDSAA